MPLLRQALYSQNINLYLAPTADGRDAWLSLMRTIAIEGRCFVLSSNMCIRGAATQTDTPNGILNGSTHNHHSTQDDNQQETSTGLQEVSRRRNSCLTEEGFEIALPTPALPTPAERSPKMRKRALSIFDEDGNEIVLCCKSKIPEEATADDHEASPRSQPVATMPSTGHPKPSTISGHPGFISRGGSSIVSPFGDVLAGPQWEDDEGIIYTDVDFEDCIRGRLDLDAAGSYSRSGILAYASVYSFG
jgi:nitrilase